MIILKITVPESQGELVPWCAEPTPMAVVLGLYRPGRADTCLIQKQMCAWTAKLEKKGCMLRPNFSDLCLQ